MALKNQGLRSHIAALRRARQTLELRCY